MLRRACFCLHSHKELVKHDVLCIFMCMLSTVSNKEYNAEDPSHNAENQIKFYSHKKLKLCRMTVRAYGALASLTI